MHVSIELGTTFTRNDIDYLDFASPESGLGGKIGIDATDKISPETSRTWGIPLKMSEEIVELVNKKWSKLNLD